MITHPATTGLPAEPGLTETINPVRTTSDASVNECMKHARPLDLPPDDHHRLTNPDQRRISATATGRRSRRESSHASATRKASSASWTVAGLGVRRAATVRNASSSAA